MLKFLRKGSYLFVNSQPFTEGNENKKERYGAVFLSMNKGNKDIEDNKLTIALNPLEVGQLIYYYDHLLNNNTEESISFVHPSTEETYKVIKIVRTIHKDQTVFALAASEIQNKKQIKKFTMMLSIGEFAALITYLKTKLVSLVE